MKLVLVEFRNSSLICCVRWQGFTYVAPSVLEEIHKPQVVKARSPRKGLYQHYSGHFSGTHHRPSQPMVHPSDSVHNGGSSTTVGVSTRTTGFLLNNTPQYVNPTHQHHQDEEMMDTSTTTTTYASTGPVSHHFYPGNYPLPPHLWIADRFRSNINNNEKLSN